MVSLESLLKHHMSTSSLVHRAEAASMAMLFLLSVPCMGALHSLPSRPLLIHNETMARVTWQKLEGGGDKALNTAVEAARGHAVGQVSAGPFSVTFCPSTPPSGDKHDYMSTGVYWWPCAAVNGTGPCNVTECQHKPCNCTSMDICGKRSADCNMTTGLPWYSCDGHENIKQIQQGGLPQLSGMGTAVSALAEGFYWTRNETFAQRAVELINVFFIDKKTKMNPNFRFGQAFPGINDGCGSGLVEIDEYLIMVLEAINLISRPAPCPNCAASPAWTLSMDRSMTAWLTQWSDWMKSSPFSTWACNFINNHNAACRSSWLAVAAWIGDDELARALLMGAKEPQWTNTSNSSMPYQKLGAANCEGCGAPCSGTCGKAPIGGQILKDGELPEEAGRVNSVGYTCAEIGNLFRLAQLSRHPIFADVPSDNLYNYISATGSAIRGALDYVAPFALGEKKWPHPSEAADWELYPVLLQAASVWNNATYSEWATRLMPSGCGTVNCAGDSSNLWWPTPRFP